MLIDVHFPTKPFSEAEAVNTEISLLLRGQMFYFQGGVSIAEVAFNMKFGLSLTK